MKKIRKTKKVMKFLTGLCQDDVTTSNSDDISRNEFHINVREKISGDVTKGILQICHGSGVMQHIPWLVHCVLTSSDICHLVRTISNYFSVCSRRVKVVATNLKKYNMFYTSHCTLA